MTSESQREHDCLAYTHTPANTRYQKLHLPCIKCMHAAAGVKHLVPRAAFVPASQRLSSQVLTLTGAGRDLYGPGYRALIKQHKHAVATGVRAGCNPVF